MKKLILLALVLCFALQTAVFAEEYKEFKLNYTLDAEGNATVTGCENFLGGTMTIPESVDGHAIVAIADGAFKGIENLYNLDIDAFVTHIGENVCEDCINLAEVMFPPTVKYIGDRAFSNCNLAIVELGSSITEMGHYAFDYNEDIVFYVNEGSYADIFVMEREYKRVVRRDDGTVDTVDIKHTRRVLTLIFVLFVLALELFVLVTETKKAKKAVKKPLFTSKRIR